MGNGVLVTSSVAAGVLVGEPGVAEEAMATSPACATGTVAVQALANTIINTKDRTFLIIFYFWIQGATIAQVAGSWVIPKAGKFQAAKMVFNRL